MEIGLVTTLIETVKVFKARISYVNVCLTQEKTACHKSVLALNAGKDKKDAKEDDKKEEESDLDIRDYPLHEALT